MGGGSVQTVVVVEVRPDDGRMGWLLVNRDAPIGSDLLVDYRSNVAKSCCRWKDARRRKHQHVVRLPARKRESAIKGEISKECSWSVNVQPGRRTRARGSFDGNELTKTRSAPLTATIRNLSRSNLKFGSCGNRFGCCFRGENSQGWKRQVQASARQARRRGGRPRTNERNFEVGGLGRRLTVRMFTLGSWRQVGGWQGTRTKVT